MSSLKHLLILLAIVVNQSVGNEPQCSRFHYEEQILEKVIRMELKMENAHTKLEELTRKVEKLENIECSTVAQTKETVAFFATMTTGRNYAAGETVVFETVKTNIGDAYSPTCGEFKAPKTGTYVFYSTVFGLSNVEIWNWISVNNEVIARFNSKGHGGRHDGGTAIATVNLAENDVVAVKNEHNDGRTFGHEYTFFGGFLLSE